MREADCNARHLRIFTCRHALMATVRERPGAAREFVLLEAALRGRAANVPLGLEPEPTESAAATTGR
jgi:hypothetical protein